MIRIGALEAGGTKMVLGIYNTDGVLLDKKVIPTRTPEDTVPEMADYFKQHQVDALGVGSFGPLDLDPASLTYGYITSTPKLSWKNYPLLKELLCGRDIPAGIDTDVNAAALAEVRQGAAVGCSSAVYITIGTGIGGGVVIDGKPLHGMIHPEVGHMLLRPHPEDTLPDGVCPYHKGCLEGLASGPALGKRCDGNAADLPDDSLLFHLEAHYLAQMCANLILLFSPQRIMLGGGVMERAQMLPMIRKETQELLGGYVQHDVILNHPEKLIVRPALFPLSGLVGSYWLGKDALGE